MSISSRCSAMSVLASRGMTSPAGHPVRHPFQCQGIEIILSVDFSPPRLAVETALSAQHFSHPDRWADQRHRFLQEQISACNPTSGDQQTSGWP